MKMYPGEPDDEIIEDEENEEDRPSSSGMLIFIAAFAVSLVLFALIGVIWWFSSSTSTPTENPDDPTTFTTTAPTDSIAISQYDERFSVAVYITDDSGDLQTVTLVMVQPDSETAPITAVGLPAELSITEADEIHTLYNSYRLPNIEVAQEALYSYFGKTIDYYVVLSYDQIEGLMTDLNSTFTYTLKTDISEQASDGSYSINLSKGTQSLRPKQIANLFRYSSWPGGKRERAEMHADVIAAYLNQYISNSRTMQNDHSALYRNASATDLSGTEFSKVLPTLKDLAGLEIETLCTTFPAGGSFSGVGNTLRFTPSQGTYDTIKSCLR